MLFLPAAAVLMAGTVSEQKQADTHEQKQEDTQSDEVPVLRTSRR